MPLIPSKLSFLPPFEGRDSLYSSIWPERRQPGGPKLKIRLLTIVPNHDHSAPVEASLSIAILDVPRHPDYNAVSYHWGYINELENVIIHGLDDGVRPCVRSACDEKFDRSSSAISSEGVHGHEASTTLD